MLPQKRSRRDEYFARVTETEILLFPRSDIDISFRGEIYTIGSAEDIIKERSKSRIYDLVSGRIGEGREGGGARGDCFPPASLRNRLLLLRGDIYESLMRPGECLDRLLSVDREADLILILSSARFVNI